ncbi:MAG TPA: nucleotidyltransferase family protein [Xanthomonadaceae bacterium]|nr:nucleotidyltransferase family protein [Xanthomonadaceae bacterium]
MKALIFAAGLGERMRPLTDRTPKPLLEVGGRALIVRHLEKLAAAGATDVVVNTSWLASRFPEALGDGSRWGLRLHFSVEGTVPLETGGGMLNALPRLRGDGGGNGAFLAINGDIYSDHDYAALPLDPAGDAHLVLVDNPEHHPAGDFMLGGDGRIAAAGEPRLTFSGIGVYRPSLFDDWRAAVAGAPAIDEVPPRFQLAPLLRAAMARDAVTGEHHRGRWTDVGTPARLEWLDAELRAEA